MDHRNFNLLTNVTNLFLWTDLFSTDIKILKSVSKIISSKVKSTQTKYVPTFD